MLMDSQMPLMDGFKRRARSGLASAGGAHADRGADRERDEG